MVEAFVYSLILCYLCWHEWLLVFFKNAIRSKPFSWLHFLQAKDVVIGSKIGRNKVDVPALYLLLKKKCTISHELIGEMVSVRNVSYAVKCVSFIFALVGKTRKKMLKLGYLDGLAETLYLYLIGKLEVCACAKRRELCGGNFEKGNEENLQIKQVHFSAFTLDY